MIKGKALMVITRINDPGEDNRFEVSTYIQACSGDWDNRDAAQEEFQHLEYDNGMLPSQAYKLASGETIRVHVVFQINYIGYGHADDDVDVDLEFTKVRVLRRQKPKPFYMRKAA